MHLFWDGRQLYCYAGTCRTTGNPGSKRRNSGEGPQTREGKKTEKAKARTDKAGEKLGKARAKLDAQKPPKEPGIPRRLAQRVALFVKRHPVGVLIVLAVLQVVMLLMGALSSLPGMIGGGAMNAVLGTSYGSEDSDLLGADEDYTALERAMADEIANIESTHPGYDEYRYQVDELGHNPYELASYLTAKFQSYTRAEVQGELQAVFDAQYKLTLTETVEIPTYTDDDGDEHEYEWYILTVTLKNRTLTDPDFAALIAEAEKYLGYPYVWGGSSPSTSFDCSGFVCWVYTHSGVYNLPRTTATGIYNQCAIIPKSEARKDMRKVTTAKANIDYLLGLTGQEKNKEQER